MRVDIKPLTVNQVWQGRRFKTKAYKTYEVNLLLMLPDMVIPAGNLVVTIKAGFSNRASDLDNIVKPFVDVLQKRYDFNDSRIYKMVLYKDIVKKGKEYIEFSIEEIT